MRRGREGERERGREGEGEREGGVLLHYFRRHLLLTNKVADPERRGREGERAGAEVSPILQRIPNEPSFSLRPRERPNTPFGRTAVSVISTQFRQMPAEIGFVQHILQG